MLGPRAGGADPEPSVRGLAATLVGAVRSRPPAEIALAALPIPTLLVALALSPAGAAWHLSLSAEGIFESRWTLWTAFASSFVHSDATHLFDNVLNYWLIVAVAYPLSVVAGWRRRFLSATLAYLAVVPVVSAWATLLAVGGIADVPAAGFSDVNAALLGYLVAVWFVALASESTPSETDRSPRGVDARWSLVAVLGSLSVVFLSPSGASYFPPVPLVAVGFAAAAALVGGWLLARRGRPRLARIGLSPARELLYVTGASVVVVGVVGSLVVVPPGSNVFAHLAGYVVGFAVPFVAILAES